MFEGLLRRGAIFQYGCERGPVAIHQGQIKVHHGSNKCDVTWYGKDICWMCGRDTFVVGAGQVDVRTRKHEEVVRYYPQPEVGETP